jgi:hypothetical protein
MLALHLFSAFLVAAALVRCSVWAIGGKPS